MHFQIILAQIRKSSGHDFKTDDIEVTMEANPADLEGDRVQEFRDAGINRLSLGIQSFNDEYLRLLNRDHDSSMAIRAVQTALEVFQTSKVSCDLIFGLPGT